MYERYDKMQEPSAVLSETHSGYFQSALALQHAHHHSARGVSGQHLVPLGPIVPLKELILLSLCL